MSAYDLSGDTAENRKKYRQRMELACRECVRGELDEEGEAQRRALLRGWYIGEKSFRNRMRNKLADAVEGRKKESLSGQAVKEYGTQRAKVLIRGSVKYFGITLRELKARRYNDWEKQMLVALLRTQTGVSYDWIRAEIRMGSRSSVYEALKRVRNEKNRTKVMEWKQLSESMKTYH